MSIVDYFTEHWVMLVPLIGMSIFLISDIHLERRMIRRIAVTNFMLFIYSIFCYIETYLGNQPEYTIWRTILTAVNYSLVTFILVETIMIVYQEQKVYLLVPAIINTVLSFISIPTGIVFTFDEKNCFHRGTLGHLAYIVSGLYLAYFVIRIFTNKRRQKEDYPILIFMSLTAVFCLVVPMFLYEAAQNWFVTTIAVDILLYYIFLLQQFTKRDPLTGLLNRQSYYSDAEKKYGIITSVITIDMNGLKEINDNKGHTAGDTALKTIADSFWKAAQRKQRVYRIGGDEFIILCTNSGEKEVNALIERIKQEIAKTPYTVSVGYAMKSEGSTIDDMYHQADVMLYEEKKRFYEITGKDRRKR